MILNEKKKEKKSDLSVRSRKFYIFTQAQNWQWHANLNPYSLTNLTSYNQQAELQD